MEEIKNVPPLGLSIPQTKLGTHSLGPNLLCPDVQESGDVRDPSTTQGYFPVPLSYIIRSERDREGSNQVKLVFGRPDSRAPIHGSFYHTPPSLPGDPRPVHTLLLHHPPSSTLFFPDCLNITVVINVVIYIYIYKKCHVFPDVQDKTRLPGDRRQS